MNDTANIATVLIIPLAALLMFITAVAWDRFWQGEEIGDEGEPDYE